MKFLKNVKIAYILSFSVVELLRLNTEFKILLKGDMAEARINAGFSRNSDTSKSTNMRKDVMQQDANHVLIFIFSIPIRS